MLALASSFKNPPETPSMHALAFMNYELGHTDLLYDKENANCDAVMFFYIALPLSVSHSVNHFAL